MHTHPYLRIPIYFSRFLLISLIATFLFILVSLTIMPFDDLLAYQINSRIAHYLWNRMQYVFEYSHRASITLSGDVLPENENAIVIANHYSYSDFYLVNALAGRKRMLPYCRWFIKSSLKWQLPIFGWCMYLIGMIMVSRDWLRDSNSIRRAFEGLKQPPGVGKKVWLVSFLEGTRITQEKLLESQNFSKLNDQKVLKNLLVARTKSFLAAVKQLRQSQVTHVYDLTLAYQGPRGFGQAPDLLTINSLTQLSPKYRFHIHVRRWNLNELPEDENELKNWIETVWEEKDEILEGLKKDWINWTGLIGWGSKPSGQSGACGVYYDPLYPPRKLSLNGRSC